MCMVKGLVLHLTLNIYKKEIISVSYTGQATVPVFAESLESEEDFSRSVKCWRRKSMM